MAASSPAPPPQSTFVRHLQTGDAKLSYYLHSLFNPYLPIFLLLLLEYSADFRLFFPVSAALLLSPRLLPFASPLIFGLLLDLALIGLIKFIFRRSRPVYNPNMSPVASVDNFSFPSGHASRVFFVATVISLSSQAIAAALVELRSGSGGGFVDRWFGGDERNVVGIVVAAVYAWAATTATSRVLLGRHYVLDVLAGACVGVLEGLFAFRFLRFEDFFRLRAFQWYLLEMFLCNLFAGQLYSSLEGMKDVFGFVYVGLFLVASHQIRRLTLKFGFDI